MIPKNKENIVRILKVLWKFWEERNGLDWPSTEGELFLSEFDDLYREHGFKIGLEDTVPEKSFWWCALISNENFLFRGDLTTSNLKVPELKKYNVKHKEDVTIFATIHYETPVLTYMNENQLEVNFWDLTGYLGTDIYENEIERYNHDVESSSSDIEKITEIK